MKRIVFALGLVAATAIAAPLAAQTRNDGPWWDPANTGTRSGSTTTRDDGRIYDRNGSVYGDRNGTIYDRRDSDSRRADGRWRAAGRDRNGNTLYVRTRYDRNGNLIQERARRDRLGRYRVIDSRVLQSANRRNDRRHREHDNDDHDWDDRRDRNDRWDQNGGHDNGKHNGQNKNKQNGKSKNKGRR